VVLFFFQKKKQKALFCFAEGYWFDPSLGEADPGGLGACPQQNSTLSHFFFQKKKQKVLFCFAEGYWFDPNFGEADPGGSGGLAPRSVAVRAFMSYRPNHD
jgi:hypothetical protein